MDSNRLKILFLPRWYPNRFDPMPGLFFRHQAESLVDSCEVAVLSVHPGVDVPNKYEIDIAWESGVFVIRVYYRIPEKNTPVIGNLVKTYRYYKANKLGLRMLRTFKADVVHVHVLTRAGVIALLNKIRTGTPYVVTEHWSRYFPENDSYKGWLRKLLTKLVVRKASAVIAVSEKLKKAMQAHKLDNPLFNVIPNMVDVENFIPSHNPALPVTRRIVHISCFEDRSKNITGFLRAIKNVSLKRSDFVCDMIGDGPDFQMCKSYALSLGLGDLVEFKGMQTDGALVSLLNTADFLVLSSNYETFGTVVIESLSCGVPVVSTRVGVVQELINQDNGITVPPGDEDALATAILHMLDICRQFDHSSIREGVISVYDSRSIAKRIRTTYQAALGIEK